MLNILNLDQVYLACCPTDLRKSIDGLATLVKIRFKLDPFSNCLFVFCNRNRNKIKILEWEFSGFWLHYKTIKPSEQIGTKALTGKNYCDQLFSIEKKLLECTSEERYKKRLEMAKPVLDEFYAWLKSFGAVPQSALGKAVNYTLGQWKYLVNYLQDGRCEICNNRAERSIKLFVIGRKNFMFSDTVKGAKASAIAYSIIETAKENGLNPMNYLSYLFERMPNVDFKNNLDVFESLFPWGQLPENCYIKKSGE